MNPTDQDRALRLTHFNDLAHAVVLTIYRLRNHSKLYVNHYSLFPLRCCRMISLMVISLFAADRNDKNIIWFANLLQSALFFHTAQGLDNRNRNIIESPEFDAGLSKLLDEIRQHYAAFDE